MSQLPGGRESDGGDFGGDFAEMAALTEDSALDHDEVYVVQDNRRAVGQHGIGDFESRARAVGEQVGTRVVDIAPSVRKVGPEPSDGIFLVARGEQTAAQGVGAEGEPCGIVAVL